MDKDNPSQRDYGAAMRTWEQEVPRWRRYSARIGIQGKLILGFLLLLYVALAGSYIVVQQGTRSMFGKVIGQGAIEVSQTLALASENSLEVHDLPELSRIARDLLKNRDIVMIAFHDADGKPQVVSSQDPDFAAQDGFAAKMIENTRQLMQVRNEYSPVLGNYVEVTAPVLGYANSHTRSLDPMGLRFLPPTNDNRGNGVVAGVRGGNEGRIAGSDVAGPRLMGYVTVAMVAGSQQEHLHRMTVMIAAVGGGVLLLSLPMVYAMVSRILLPIRQLVAATHRITEGELDAQVEVHRPDLIGTLARSFNEMVWRVKEHQVALAEANKMLADANCDLEEKVLRRTAELERANGRLCAEIAEKEDFLRAVSHDLNAPLRNIAGMASMLLMKYKSRLDEDMTHRLERIQKNVEVESDLINELLELSRIKTRRHVMEKVEIGAMVHQIGELFENDLRSHNIRLLIDTPLPVLECERSRLRQVFQNLIDNAIKYMGDRPVREIHVGCTLGPREAEFYVRDTGIGIESEDAAKCFFVFRRGRNITGVPGKGVGLASVKSIIETYGGRIWLTSKPGEGSTFYFTIDGKHVPVIQVRPEAQPVSADEPDQADDGLVPTRRDLAYQMPQEKAR